MQSASINAQIDLVDLAMFLPLLIKLCDQIFRARAGKPHDARLLSAEERGA
jgi:hypothetical protein